MRWRLHRPEPGPSRPVQLSPQRALLDILLKSAIRRHERQVQRVERELPRRFLRRSPLSWEIRASQRHDLQEESSPTQRQLIFSSRDSQRALLNLPLMAEERPPRRAEPLFQLLGEERRRERSRLLFPQEEDEQAPQRHLQREEMRYRPWHAIPPQREMPDLLPALRPQRAPSRSLPLLIPLRTEDEVPQRSWNIRQQRRPMLWPEASPPQRVLLQASHRATQRLLLSQESRTIRRPSARSGMRFSRSPQLIRAVMEEPRPPRRLVLLVPMRDEAWFPQRLSVRFPRREDGMPQQPAIDFRLMDENDFLEEPEEPEEPFQLRADLHVFSPEELQSMDDEIREVERPLMEEERHRRRPARQAPQERPVRRPSINRQRRGGDVPPLPEELRPLIADMRRPPSPAPHFPLMPDAERPPSPAPNFPLMPDQDRPPSPAPHVPLMPDERHPQRPAPHLPLMAEERRPRRPALHFPLLEDERRPRRPALHEAIPVANRELPEELAAIFPQQRRPQRPAINVPLIPNERRPERPNIPPMAGERPQEQPAPILQLQEENRPAQRPLLEGRLWRGNRRPRRGGPALLPVPRPPPWPPPITTWINLLLHQFVTLLKVGDHRVYPVTPQDGSQDEARPAGSTVKVRPFQYTASAGRNKLPGMNPDRPKRRTDPKE